MKSMYFTLILFTFISTLVARPLQPRLGRNKQQMPANQSDQIDSVITTDNQGARLKYIYSYNQDHLINDIYIKRWTGSNWEDYYRHTYSYNTGGRLEGILVEVYSTFSSVWNNWEQYTFTYNAEGKVLTDLKQKFSGSTWADYRKYSYTYDSGDLISDIYELAQGTDPMENYLKFDYFYDTQHHLVDKITLRWDSNNWVKWKRDSLNYSGNRRSECFNFLWSNADANWYYRSKSIFSYNGAGYLSSALIQSWDDFNKVWVDDTTRVCTYTNENLLAEELTKKMSGGQWLDYSLSTFAYNADGNIRTHNYQFMFNGLWMTDVRQFTFYDYYGNRFSFRTGKIEVYYGTPVAIHDEPGPITEYALYQNYPNPFNPTTTISYTLAEASPVQLNVYDIQGKEVAKLVNEEQVAGKYAIHFNASKLASGLYYYTLKSGRFAASRKFVLLR